MKKLSVLIIVILIFSLSVFAEESKSNYPTSFSCVIEEEYQKDATASPEKNTFDYYQIKNMYRWDAFGIAYVIDDNKHMYYNVMLGMNVYTEKKINKSALEILDSLGGGLLNPGNFKKIEDTGKTETINGYECKVMKVNDNKVTRLVWQATLLGNLGMKYEASKGAEKYTKLVTNLVLDFNDETVFNLPEGGKANLIMGN